MFGKNKGGRVLGIIILLTLIIGFIIYHKDQVKEINVQKRLDNIYNNLNLDEFKPHIDTIKSHGKRFYNNVTSQNYDGIKNQGVEIYNDVLEGVGLVEVREPPQMEDDNVGAMDELDEYQQLYENREMENTRMGVENTINQQNKLLTEIEVSNGVPLAYEVDVIRSEPGLISQINDFSRNVGYVQNRNEARLVPRRVAEEYYDLEIDCPKGCALIGREGEEVVGCINPVDSPDNCVFAHECRGCKEYDVDIFEAV
jgi:hypothetical protein